MLRKLIYSLCLIGVFLFCLFMLNKHEYFQVLDVEFSAGNEPMIEIEIEGKKIPVFLDTGSKFLLGLNENVLKPLTKKEIGKDICRNARGDRFDCIKYSIPKIKIGEIVLENVSTAQDIPTLLLWTEKSEGVSFKDPVGILGRPFLEDHNVLLNFPSSTMVITNSAKKLSELGYDLKNMIKVPMLEGRGIIIEIETEFGKKRVGLDTGTTISCFRSSDMDSVHNLKEAFGYKYCTSSYTKIGSSNFEPIKFYLFDISSELNELDGVLGMNFLKEHPMYLDYKNKMVYIQPSENL